MNQSPCVLGIPATWTRPALWNPCRWKRRAGDVGSASVVRDADFVSSLPGPTAAPGRRSHFPCPRWTIAFWGGWASPQTTQARAGGAQPPLAFGRLPKAGQRSWAHVRLKRGPHVGPGKAGAQGRWGGPPEAGVLNNGGV